MSKAYKFKEWIPTSEAVKVAELIKYTGEGGYFSEEVIKAHPELISYFDEVEVED